MFNAIKKAFISKNNEIEKLIEQIENNTCGLSLSFHDKKLNGNQIKRIVKALEENKTLCDLDLGQNNIQGEILKKINAFLYRNKETRNGMLKQIAFNIHQMGHLQKTMRPQNSEYRIKITLTIVGISSSGKSTSTAKFLDGDVNPAMKDGSMHVDAYHTNDFFLVKEAFLNIEIKDCPGQNNKDSISRMELKRTNAILFFHSISDKLEDTIQKSKSLLLETCKIPILMVGSHPPYNEMQRVFSYEEGVNFANKSGYSGYLECSAKTGYGIQDVFLSAILFGIKELVQNECDRLDIQKQIDAILIRNKELKPTQQDDVKAQDENENSNVLIKAANAQNSIPLQHLEQSTNRSKVNTEQSKAEIKNNFNHSNIFTDNILLTQPPLLNTQDLLTKPIINFMTTPIISQSSLNPIIHASIKTTEQDIAIEEVKFYQEKNQQILNELEKYQMQLLQNQTILNETQTQLQNLRESLPHAKGKALVILQGQEKELIELLKKEDLEQQKLKEQQLILNDAKLCDYYYVFQVQFNGIFIACKAIHSEMVANDKSSHWGKAAKGIEKISQHIPIAGLIGEVLVGALNYLDYRAKKEAVNRVANFFTGVTAAEFVGEVLARQLTLAQVKKIQDLQTNIKIGFVKRQLENLNKLKNYFLINDIDSAIKELADKHCQAILTDIMKGKVKPNPNAQEVQELLNVIMDQRFVYQSPINSDNNINSLTSTSQLFSDNVSVNSSFTPYFQQRKNSNEQTKEEIQKLKVLVDAQEKQLKVQEESIKSQVSFSDIESLQIQFEEQKKLAVLREKQAKEFEKKLKEIEEASGISVGGTQQQMYAQPNANVQGIASNLDLQKEIHQLAQRLKQLEMSTQMNLERIETTESVTLANQAEIEKQKNKMGKK